MSPHQHLGAMGGGADGPSVEDIEIDVFLEAIARAYGYDFRDYARASLRRRLWRRAAAEHRTSISGLLETVLHDREAMERLRFDLSVTTTSMFRDPPFFLALRSRVLPLLRTYPFIRIWVAGCASGEELYSLSILLHEEGLTDRVRIYATDVSDEILDQAQRGQVRLDRMRAYSSNYLEAGGHESLSHYYEAEGSWARLDASLRRGVLFARHNLVTDGTFNEFHLILCRNVLIYFNRTLQGRVHHLFDDSLVTLGLLGLGARESLAGTAIEDRYEEIASDMRLYRKKAA